MRFYMHSGRITDMSQDTVRRVGGRHGIAGFGTETVPLLEREGIEIERFPAAERLQQHPGRVAEIWGAYFEQVVSLPKFHGMFPQFDVAKRWLIVRIHTAGDNGRPQVPTAFAPYLQHINVVLTLHENVSEGVNDMWGLDPSVPVAVCPWGVATWWDYPPPQSNPYEPGTINLLWCGRLHTQDKHRVDALWAIYKKDPEIRVHIITPTKPEWLDMSLLPPNCVNHGFMAWGTFNHYIYYADVGLNVSFRGRRPIDCKIYDYLGMGCPVVTTLVSASELVTETGHGIVLDDYRPEAYADAVMTALQHPFGNRDAVISYMQANHGWDKSGAILAKYVKMGMDLGYAD